MKTIKRTLSLVIATVVMLSIVPSIVVGDDNIIIEQLDLYDYESVYDTAEDMVALISHEDYYSSWENATVEFGYELFNEKLDNVQCLLFYVIENNTLDGYIIVDCNTNITVEFSKGVPPFDLINSQEQGYFVYAHGMPVYYANECYYFVNADGMLDPYQYSSNNVSIMTVYDPQLQGSDNCIVAAISNLFWFHSQNGYPALVGGHTFSWVKSNVNAFMVAAGGYKNSNIPATIYTYVYSYANSYSVSVTNSWYPSFSNVQNEVYYRPCLLGFAAGTGSYSTTVGHMTVCVNTAVFNSIKYVALIDGHSSDIVVRLWGNYNDFMSYFVI